MRRIESCAISGLTEGFWARLSPCLAEQLKELCESETLDDLARLWGYADRKGVWQYLRGPLRRRIEREGGDELLRRIMREMQ